VEGIKDMRRGGGHGWRRREGSFLLGQLADLVFQEYQETRPIDKGPGQGQTAVLWTAPTYLNKIRPREAVSEKRRSLSLN